MNKKGTWNIIVPLLTLVTGVALGVWGYRAHTLRVLNAPIFMPYHTDVCIDSTNLPIVFINTEMVDVERNSYITARVKIIDNGDGNLNYGDTLLHPSQSIGYDGYMAIKYRGYSSYMASPKKSYAIRALDKPISEGGVKRSRNCLVCEKERNGH